MRQRSSKHATPRSIRVQSLRNVTATPGVRTLYSGFLEPPIQRHQTRGLYALDIDFVINSDTIPVLRRILGELEELRTLALRMTKDAVSRLTSSPHAANIQVGQLYLMVDMPMQAEAVFALRAHTFPALERLILYFPGSPGITLTLGRNLGAVLTPSPRSFDVILTYDRTADIFFNVASGGVVADQIDTVAATMTTGASRNAPRVPRRLDLLHLSDFQTTRSAMEERQQLFHGLSRLVIAGNWLARTITVDFRQHEATDNKNHDAAKRLGLFEMLHGQRRGQLRMLHLTQNALWSDVGRGQTMQDLWELLEEGQRGALGRLRILRLSRVAIEMRGFPVVKRLAKERRIVLEIE